MNRRICGGFGAGKLALFCVTAAALSAILMFAVCQAPETPVNNNPAVPNTDGPGNNPGTGPGTDPGNNPGTGGGGGTDTNTVNSGTGGGGTDTNTVNPGTGGGGYCDYGFGNCVASSEAACGQYGAFTQTCPAATGYYSHLTLK